MNICANGDTGLDTSGERNVDLAAVSQDQEGKPGTKSDDNALWNGEEVRINNSDLRRHCR